MERKALPPKALRPLAALALVALVAGLGWWQFTRPPANPMASEDAQVLARGQAVYEHHCAGCHGAKLEGQGDWRERLPNGKLPAPPHDASGHTWHHASPQLFGIVKHGVQAYAPAGYQSDMPAYDGVLSDAEIWAVLAFIRSTWPEEIRRKHASIDEAQRARQR